MLSAYHGHVSIVKLLLSHGANPNCLNDRGQSPLAGVVFKSERECIFALLEGGADPEIGDPSAIGACEVSLLFQFGRRHGFDITAGRCNSNLSCNKKRMRYIAQGCSME
jgi:ankyrin repeat protein